MPWKAGNWEMENEWFKSGTRARHPQRGLCTIIGKSGWPGLLHVQFDDLRLSDLADGFPKVEVYDLEPVDEKEV